MKRQLAIDLHGKFVGMADGVAVIRERGCLTDIPVPFVLQGEGETPSKQELELELASMLQNEGIFTLHQLKV